MLEEYKSLEEAERLLHGKPKGVAVRLREELRKERRGAEREELTERDVEGELKGLVDQDGSNYSTFRKLKKRRDKNKCKNLEKEGDGEGSPGEDEIAEQREVPMGLDREDFAPCESGQEEDSKHITFDEEPEKERI